MKILWEGAAGEAVRRLQDALIELGLLDGEADGRFGPDTRAAVEAFQRERGLPADGLAGPQTLRALGLADAPAARGVTRSPAPRRPR